MKSLLISNSFDPKQENMTLRDYYFSLPERQHLAPRKDLLTAIANECGVSYTTVRSWFCYGIKPRNEEYIEIISRHTGIKPEDMWRG